jgi:hypothetical protein
MALTLARIPDSSDFDGAKGKTVKLVMNDHIGVVLIAKGEYAGNQLVPDGHAVATLDFPVAPGQNTLKLVFVFTASTNGRSELREQDGSASQFLRDVSGDEPFLAFRINGK